MSGHVNRQDRARRFCARMEAPLNIVAAVRPWAWHLACSLNFPAIEGGDESRIGATSVAALALHATEAMLSTGARAPQSCLHLDDWRRPHRPVNVESSRNPTALNEPGGARIATLVLSHPNLARRRL